MTSTGANRCRPCGRDELPGELTPGRWLLAALVLAAFGLVMVGSASIAIADGEGVGPFAILLKHAGLYSAAARCWRRSRCGCRCACWRNSRVLLLLMFLLLLRCSCPASAAA